MTYTVAVQGREASFTDWQEARDHLEDEVNCTHESEGTDRDDFLAALDQIDATEEGDGVSFMLGGILHVLKVED